MYSPELLFSDRTCAADAKRNSLALAVLTGYINPKTSVSWCLWIPRFAMLEHIPPLACSA